MQKRQAESGSCAECYLQKAIIHTDAGIDLTADIVFRPYPPDKLAALAEQPADGRQRYNARKLVAEFFGVTEYEIQKAVKLTQLIPELSDILENTPKQLNLACADLIADYDGKTYDGPAQENIL